MNTDGWRGPTMRATGTWLRFASENEALFLARLTILAYVADEEDDLITLAISLDVPAMWGETSISMRTRILERGKVYFRVRRPTLPEPRLHWWAGAINELPVSWRPALRTFVDKLRGRARKEAP